MEFGLFIEFPWHEGATETGVFAESFALVEAAEAMGVEAVWVAEYHFDPNRSVLSAPITIASAIAARTKRMKIGLGVHVLPLRNPVRVAEEVATLDHISGGRVDFGVGRSAFPRAYLGYGMAYGESRERFAECLEVILRAWTNERFSFHGQYYQYQDVHVVPKPLQRPHPPIRIGATSADTFGLVGHMGYPIFINPSRVFSLLALAPFIEEYQQAYQDAGHPGDMQIGLRVPVYVAETIEQAYAEPKESTLYQMRRLIQVITASAMQSGIGTNDNRLLQAERLKSMSYEDVVQNMVIYGTPEMVVDRLRQLQEALGLTQIVYEVNFGCHIPYELQAKCLQLMQERVIPHFK